MECPYCAQTSTHKDQYGYCKKYNCFSRSGKQSILDNLKKEAFSLSLTKDSWRNIGSVVTNPYNQKTREFNDLMYKAEKEFGFVPLELYKEIPMKYRERWDKNVRW